MPQKRWIRVPEKVAKPKVPADEKLLIEQKCNDFINNELKPKLVVTNPENYKFKYIVDVFGKWNRNFFYFGAIYQVKHPMAISPVDEFKFARLEYTGKDRFSIAYMRHTGKWWEIRTGLSLEESFEEIITNPVLQPISL
jgi:hypothetical protein